VIAAEALKRALVVTRLVRFDARQHHSVSTFRAGWALYDLRGRRSKMKLTHVLPPMAVSESSQKPESAFGAALCLSIVDTGG
jgi:hypothetical protein